MAPGVMVVGLAYKKNVDDMREFPRSGDHGPPDRAWRCGHLSRPVLPVIPPTREHRHLAGQRSVPLDPSTPARL